MACGKFLFLLLSCELSCKNSTTIHHLQWKKANHCKCNKASSWIDIDYIHIKHSIILWVHTSQYDLAYAIILRLIFSNALGSHENNFQRSEIISWVLMTSLPLMVQKFCKAITRIMKTLLKTSLLLPLQPTESSVVSYQNI